MTAAAGPAPFDLVAIGEALIEFNQREATEPALYQRGFGGDTSNCVIAAARLGARCAYVSQVGDDDWGDALRALWRDEGVATDGVAVRPGAPTGAYFVSHGPAGHRFSYRRAGSAASRLRPEDLPRDVIVRARQFHCSGISLAISDSACDATLAALALARGAGARLSFDLNYRPALWPAARALALARQVLADCDLFFPSVDEIALLTGLSAPADILRWSHDQGARAVVLKLGAQGCWVSDAGGAQHLPAHAVTPVDATGAGDCFAGACLARLAAGATLAEAARVANVAAALSTQGFGAVAPLPRPQDLRAAGLAL